MPSRLLCPRRFLATRYGRRKVFHGEPVKKLKAFSQRNLKKVCCLSWQNFGASVEGSRKGNTNPPPGTKGGEKMNPAQFEWQTRCEFNAYCKRTLRNELIDACRESKSQQKHEVNFSDLAPFEEKQLYTVDRSAKSNICHFINQKEE